MPDPPRKHPGAPRAWALPQASGRPRSTNLQPPSAGGGSAAPAPPPPGGGPRQRPKLKKLRVLLLLFGLGLLAMVSTVFGMMMAVSQSLPELEAFAQYRSTDNTVVLDARGEKIGTLTSDDNKTLVDSGEISANVKNAVVAIEDARFYEHSGVDFQGIARALIQDVITRSFDQGGSTITQQFVKQATETQDERTPLQKLREAALAYHLERNWTKDRILTAYLNTVYFGQGAYGVEAAARTYFGASHPGCGSEQERCASVLTPAEAAMLAGIVQSPAVWDPKSNPEAAKNRRDTVLQRMQELGYISPEQYEEARSQALPAPDSISPPPLDSDAPYFTSWLRPQLVGRLGPARAFFGGYRVKSTLDMELQQAAEEAVDTHLGAIEPTAAVVVIDNETGGVKAMVGGRDYEERPFNLATQGHRQPGSSIKPFTLLTALEEGISPDSVWSSEPKTFPVPGSRNEVFPVANYDDNYLGSASLRSATTYSDNSVFAELGIEVGTANIARTIRSLGYSRPISTNPAMTLGGLELGVTPLEWTYAFSTLANEGSRVSGTLAAGHGSHGYGPLGFTRVVRDADGEEILANRTDSTQVVSEESAATAKEMLHSVVTEGTGTRASLDNPTQWGKTGTTDENGDAWYCGAIDIATACVWVGHADSNTPMHTEYAGLPVDGGTYPALIWRDVMSRWVEILEAREAEEEAEEAEEAEEDEENGEPELDPAETTPASETTDPAEPAESGSDAEAEGAPEGEPAADSDPGSGPSATATPADGQGQRQQQPQPQAQQPAPTGEGGGNAGSGGGVSPSGGAPPE